MTTREFLREHWAILAVMSTLLLVAAYFVVDYRQQSRVARATCAWLYDQARTRSDSIIVHGTRPIDRRPTCLAFSQGTP